MIPQATHTATNVKLPLMFMLYGLLAFVAGQIILFMNVDLIMAGGFRTPQIWMAVHLLLLGFTLMIVMGAMYQLVPVAFLTPIWNERFGFIQLFVTAIGIILLAFLLGFSPGMAIYGGIITVIGILMFMIQMIVTISKQKDKNIMTLFVITAIVFLLLTIIAGFLLVWNLAFYHLGSHEQILYSHIAFGISGWFTLLIFAFSYKLVPMFSLSHGFSMKWARLVFCSYLLGLLIFILSFWTDHSMLQIAGALCLLIGFSLFVLDMKEILDKRMKKKLDRPFSFSLLAILNGLVLHIFIFIFSVIGLENPFGWSWLVFLYMMCWIIFSILGYLYKIVPFLWWTHKYAPKIGKGKVPLLKDMINEKMSVILFILFMIAVFGLVVGATMQISIIVVLFQGLLIIASILYLISILQVLFV